MMSSRHTPRKSVKIAMVSFKGAALIIPQNDVEATYTKKLCYGISVSQMTMDMFHLS
jgi:hypothetical protein